MGQGGGRCCCASQKDAPGNVPVQVIEEFGAADERNSPTLPLAVSATAAPPPEDAEDGAQPGIVSQSPHGSDREAHGLGSDAGKSPTAASATSDSPNGSRARNGMSGKPDRPKLGLDKPLTTLPNILDVTRSTEEGKDDASDPPQDGAYDNGVFDTQGTLKSTGSSWRFQEMTKDQRLEAKRLIKDFVKTMVRGRQFSVIMPNGVLRNCHCSLSRKLDALVIRSSPKDKNERKIPLTSIEEILAGSDKTESAAFEGLKTPLDDLSVTLALNSGECISFRLPDMEARDTLVMCLTMFSNQVREERT
eukprot:gnl/TRDRNA2_/TRDRNA2_193465_c0_seq1.p1 gnl/TRDRNA2_/TRDRNA2_193465_c0~~gnl/TRDRNA2_/TRDRNA2_193465_c0_seq1.p1  ORF type:complete len:354 (-),score=59.30 gnl/TRDRNA2_/TRDRNA2_193465_c0_seq1:67-981(-)